MELEDEQYDAWKRWAGRQIDTVRAEQDAAYTSYGVEEDADINAETEDELSGMLPDVDIEPEQQQGPGSL